LRWVANLCQIRRHSPAHRPLGAAERRITRRTRRRCQWLNL
jgi:hypothetical protein